MEEKSGAAISVNHDERGAAFDPGDPFPLLPARSSLPGDLELVSLLSKVLEAD